MTEETTPEKTAQDEVICPQCGLKTPKLTKGKCTKCYLQDRTSVVLYANERARLKLAGLSYRDAILESLERHERRKDPTPGAQA